MILCHNTNTNSHKIKTFLSLLDQLREEGIHKQQQSSKLFVEATLDAELATDIQSSDQRDQSEFSLKTLYEHRLHSPSKTDFPILTYQVNPEMLTTSLGILSDSHVSVTMIIKPLYFRPYFNSSIFHIIDLEFTTSTIGKVRTNG
jgi:hypothetical protein